MPGIAGLIVDRPLTEAHRSAVDVMTRCMLHDDSYECAVYSHDEIGLCVGSTSFKHLALTTQPISNQSKDVLLIFSGEHYGDVDDVACLPELYEKKGPQCFEALNGMFSGILADLRNKKLFLFNDRYGLNRIYYCERPNGFYFSSEAKSILKALPEVRKIDWRGLGEFFACGCVLQNRSLFSELSLLPGGSNWEFSLGSRVKKSAYFQKAQWETGHRLNEDEYYNRLKDTFPGILQRYLAGGPIGVSLTGGVDSRLIMAWAKAQANSLPCYTFGSKYRDSIDVKVARQVATITHQPHQVIRVGDEFLREFPCLAERTVQLTDGVMDVSGAADLFVNNVAKRIAPLRLTGNYGGEILRNLVAFKPIRIELAAFDPEFVAHIHNAAKTYRDEMVGNPVSFVAFKQLPWHHYSRLCLERSQVVMRSPYLDNDLVQLAYQAPSEAVRNNEHMLRLINEGNPSLGSLSTDRGVSAKRIPIWGALRHQLQEFTFKAEYAYDYGMPQKLASLDSLLAPLHLERMFLGRHKFQHFRIWYRDNLAPYLKEILLDSRTTTRPYLKGKDLEEMVRQHTRGTHNHTLEFHRMLTCELLQRQLIEMN